MLRGSARTGIIVGDSAVATPLGKLPVIGQGVGDS